MLLSACDVQGCSAILQWWRDHRLEFSDVSDLAINMICMTATSATNERVFSIDGNVVNSRRANLKRSSVNGELYQQCSEKAQRVD